MNWFSKTWDSIRRAFKGLTITSGGTGGWVTPNTRFNYGASVGQGMGSSIVMAPVNWICRTFPEAPPRLLKRTPAGEPQEVARHRMIRLLRDPNPFYSGTLLWRATMLSFAVNGNAYWRKVRPSAGDLPDQLWYVPHWMIEPRWDPQGNEFVTHYEFQRTNAAPEEIPNSEIVHFRNGLDPNNIRKGMSPLASVLREIYTDDEAANFTAALLRNMGVPGLVVSPKDKDDAVTTEAAGEVKQYLIDSFRGDKRGEPIVMKRPTEVYKFGFSPEELNLRALRRIPEERVTAALGVAAIVAGLGAGLDRSTFTNFQEAREAAYEEQIIPTQRLIADDIWKQLLSDFENDISEFEVDFDLSRVRVLMTDQNALAQRWSTIVLGGIAEIAEARRDLGLPVDDSHRVFLRPMSLSAQPAGSSELTAVERRVLIESVGSLVRSGFDPVESLESVGLEPIEHLGFLPVTLQSEELIVAEGEAAAEEELSAAAGRQQMVPRLMLNGKGKNGRG